MINLVGDPLEIVDHPDQFHSADAVRQAGRQYEPKAVARLGIPGHRLHHRVRSTTHTRRQPLETFSRNQNKHATPTPSTMHAIAMPNRSTIWKAVAAAAATIAVAACSGGTPPPRALTLTLVRQADWQTDGMLNTDPPGPDLTDQGRNQAQQLATQLAPNNYDAIYASELVRTQQTAAPLAQNLGKKVEILSGLNQFAAGTYDHQQLSQDEQLYYQAPRQWIAGNRQPSIPGSLDGNEFNDQFSGAVKAIYDSGHTKPIAFSSGGAVEIWTLMNVKNAKPSLLDSHPLPYGAQVVVTGSPATGWTLVEWGGVRDNFS
jgi:broad specificity phosphatase PhoE